VAGDSFNTAVALSSLGVATEYVTATGDTPVGRRLPEAMALWGVGGRYLQVLPGASPGAYLISVDAAGERSFSYWRDRSAARQLFRDTDRMGSLCERIPSGQWLYLTGITLAIASAAVRDLLAGFVERYRAGGGRIAFDCNHRSALWPDLGDARRAYEPFLSSADLFLPGQEDMVSAWQLAAEDVADFLASLAVQCTMLKRGADGPLVLVDGRRCEPDCRGHRHPVDTTGAGDAFNGAAMAALLLGAAPEQAAVFAHGVAADVVDAPGALLPADRWNAHRSRLGRLDGIADRVEP
jgi:2-dehydro-3-deoxygluconokinase